MAFPVEKLQKRRLACSDVIACAYDLKGQDVKVYDALNDLGPARTEDVAAHVGREASVVYRNLQKLVGCGIVEKEKAALEGGGYYHRYRALPKQQVKAELTRCVDDWHAQMRAAIDRL